MEFIRQFKSDADLRQTPILSVSNYEDAQLEAIELGSLRGFGKAALRAL